MAQLERPQSQRYVDGSKNPATIQTMEQLLRGEASKSSKSKLSPSKSSSSSACSSPSSPFFQRLRHHDTEEDHGQNQKKSVMTKVKEKAKKLRHSLSKKRHEDWNPISPSSGSGQEGDGAEEDAECRGAPMYESEKAPEGYNGYVRQHSRMSPKSPQKHVLSNNEKLGLEQAREKTLNRSLSKKTTQPAAAPAATAATTPSGPSKILTKPVAEKNLTPAYAEGSETAQYITSKFQGLSVSKPGEHHSSSTTAATTHKPSSLTIRASRTPPAKMPSQTGQSTPRASSNPMGTPTPSPPASAPPIASSTSPTSQIWDKGVSVKEYLMNKFEPGEDEKALSKVISEAMSPRRNPGDVGVIEKVREAVTSLLRTEEPTKPEDTNTTNTTHTPSQVSASTSTTRTPSQVSASTSTTRAPSQVSASTTTTRGPSQISASSTTTRSPSQVSASTSTTRTPSQLSASTSTTHAPSQVSASTSTTRAPSQVSVSTSTTRAPSRIPVSFNAQEAVQEENHGRILQAN
ncbi:polycystic kidney disease protein 1-like 3 [Trifolium pratense]|uniref:polycystic kidney disease protein 1-like 3 n=1 Tax=Trifolium pratense TaxID=57577 RepID=UPI001E69222F|nr:polycystic kidney disease protein 1-like 3 [Trifolium pratense]